MGTVIRPELSKKNPYHISKHNFYELKHFCLQYADWQRKIKYIDSGNIPSGWINIPGKEVTNPTEKLAILRARYREKIDIVNRALNSIDTCYVKYIEMSALDGIPFTELRDLHGMPYCKETFYEQYHKFFYILSQLR